MTFLLPEWNVTKNVIRLYNWPFYSRYLQIVVDESARLRGAWREKVDVRCIPLIDWLGSQVSTRVLKVEGT